MRALFLYPFQPVLSHLYLMMRFGKLTIQENNVTTNQGVFFCHPCFYRL
ncbi:hypothetical protein HanPI659440_Chr03g0127401 [Helianthus annuus]|nr:hypothetical protein HanPI659440_Chr03g0127401 [Helianthus annuus]